MLNASGESLRPGTCGHRVPQKNGSPGLRWSHCRCAATPRFHRTESGAVGPHLCRSRAPRIDGPRTNRESGSATVEFVFLSLLVLIPVLYFVLTVTRIQAAGFAVTGAADQAARLAVQSTDEGSRRQEMDRAVELALADQDLPAGAAQLTVTCEPTDCRTPGTAVTVEVAVDVQLPFTPPGFGLDVAHVRASGTQIVGRYR